MANIPNIIRTRDRIKSLPDEACAMGSWGDGGFIPATRDPECGTTACIAGWGYAVKHGGWTPLNQGSPGYATQAEEVRKEAAEFFGLKSKWQKLFFRWDWPRRYRVQAAEEGDRAAMLAILTDIIDGKIDADTLDYHQPEF
jgi:hypothetical protein